MFSMDIRHVEIDKSMFIGRVARIFYEHFYEYSPFRNG